MPFNWKNKTRRNRFSQLVADHLQSPKHGGSLVVETGFPTSLIDLYVRNRGRFRKSSGKKPSSSCLSSPSLVSSVDLNHLSSSGSLADSNSSSGDSDYREIDEIIEEDVVVGGGEIKIENHSRTEADISVEMAKLNPVLVVALKVLLMVILVFRTKRFTIGITLSAFLLYFLESVGKRLLGRSIAVKPTVDSKSMFEYSFQETKNIKSSPQNTTLVVCNQVLTIEEQVESEQEDRSEKLSDEVRTEVLMEITHKSSRRAIMKSRIKKLVPKKLRKTSMDSEHNICCEFKEDEKEEAVKSAQDVKQLVLYDECSDSKGQIMKQNQDKIVETGRFLSSNSLSKTACNREELSRDLQQNSGCLILFLIVLVGLIRGRVVAVAIALSWCLILNMLQCRNVKFLIF